MSRRPSSISSNKPPAKRRCAPPTNSMMSCQDGDPPPLMRLFLELPCLAFGFLDVDARSRLERCCKGLQSIIKDHNTSLATGDAKSSNARFDLMDTVERLRWLPGDIGGSSDEEQRTHLQQIIQGDFCDYDEFSSKCRNNLFYDSAKLADGNLWVLWYAYWQSFEVYDLDSGEKLNFHVEGGPDRYYVNTEEESIRLCLDDDFDARFGLLCGTMFMTGTPHGPYSGPYLHVWELPTKEKDGGASRLCVDLSRPELRVVGVNMVAKDVCVVLLVSGNERSFTVEECEHCGATEECEHPRQWGTGFVLQWHRIQSRSDISKRPPTLRYSDPGPRPPEHRCGMQCLVPYCRDRLACAKWEWSNKKWQEQCRAQEEDARKDTKREATRDTSSEDGSDASSDAENGSEPEYCWWPCSETIICEHDIMFHDAEEIKMLAEYGDEPQISAKMHSDGNGILVIIVWSEIQLWHVGTRKLVRVCQIDKYIPLGQPIGALDTHTAIFPVPQDGLARDHERNVNSSSTKVPGPFLLAECGMDELAACFGRNYSENDSSSPSLRPRFECIVRIAISIFDKYSSGDQQLFLLDMYPFQHVNKSAQCFVTQRMPVNESIDEQGALSDNLSEEQLFVIWWKRGGGLDGFKGGRTELQRDIQYADHRAQPGVMYPHDTEAASARERVVKVDQLLATQRAPLMLHVDSHKLVVVTQYEISVWPYPVRATQRADWILQMALVGQRREVHDNMFARQPNTMYLDKDIQPWYSAQPFQHALFKHMQRKGHYTCSEEDFASSVLSQAVSPEQQLQLLEFVSDCGCKMILPCLSWRYFATAIQSANACYDDSWSLAAFDILCCWRVVNQLAEEKGIVLVDSDDDEESYYAE